MKYRYYKKLADEPVPGLFVGDGRTPVTGRTLVKPEDNVGHAMYEIRPKMGEKLLLKSPNPSEENHFYACLHGSGTAILTSGQKYELNTGSTLAVPPALQVEYTACADFVRVVVVHCKSSSADPNLPNPVHTHLDSLIGSERDVDWIHGRSRRFLLKADGFNLTLTSTTCHASTTSPLWYKNNYESVYYHRGDIVYAWDDRKAQAGLKQKDASEGDGLLLSMDQNDPHYVQVGAVECECLCVFSPALEGNESHDFTKEGFSIY